jgi:hypothetical protein
MQSSLFLMCIIKSAESLEFFKAGGLFLRILYSRRYFFIVAQIYNSYLGIFFFAALVTFSLEFFHQY